MSRVFSNYVEKARRILDQNWTGSYTKPAPALYPHQWNWDSAFIAMGRSHYDTPRAMLEIETLFDAQWQNGMVPRSSLALTPLVTTFLSPTSGRPNDLHTLPQGRLFLASNPSLSTLPLAPLLVIF
jgi:hypothetical protein